MEQTIRKQTIDFFISDLGSDSPAPGGGAAAGLSGALGAALGKMVADLTIGKKKYAQDQALVQAADPMLATFGDSFLALADADAEAYAGYMRALALPKDNEQQITLRKEKLQEAIREATDVPLRVVETCENVLPILENLQGHSNITCRGDLAAAAIELSCAAKIAWLNVCANLPYWEDGEAANDLREATQERVATVSMRCDRLYQLIESTF